ncbi:hypothetical protein N4T20_14975 [Flavobacterium sp. TR2]|uniref:hypothetical protein n=1 Tax=Flavobacterium sp. TR2 TaxID=2977321 RepID=UPI0021B0C790|nr:hypothetical protein [Flavobacterium sp. TR2]UWY27024.1 hypothetical protein N4T20_14975 [Flavobacterium sp. TR2]
MKKAIIYIIFLSTSALILLNRYTELYINNSIVHFIIFYASALSLVFIIGRFLGKLKTSISIFSTVFIVGVLCFINAFLTWSGDWKTQNILYQNINAPRKTIEFQMRGDRFSFGYKKRIVNRTRLFPAFDWITDIDTAAINTKEWKKNEIYVNEMKFHSQNTVD